MIDKYQKTRVIPLISKLILTNLANRDKWSSNNVIALETCQNWIDTMINSA